MPALPDAGVPDELDVEANHVDIIFYADPLIRPMNSTEVVRIYAKRGKSKNVRANSGVLARIRSPYDNTGNNNRRRTYLADRLMKDLKLC